jgi:hypothetical protein
MEHGPRVPPIVFSGFELPEHRMIVNGREVEPFLVVDA